MKAPVRGFVFLALLGTVLSSAIAQPSLTITDVVNNWPTIEISFQAYCDGERVFAVDKSTISLYEDGFEVINFALDCPDTSVTYPISACLVLDASQSMDGPRNEGAIAGANAFIDLMDGTSDEAAVLWFTSTVNTELGMTTNKTDLHDAVGSLPAEGGTAVWNGIYTGLQELILSGSHGSRGVVALSDGADNSSSHTPAEIISLSRRNRVPVYSIGLGNDAPAEMRMIADSTGGTYYHVTDPDSLIAVYEDIFRKIRHTQHFRQDCMLTYQAQCMDGAMRQVQLVVNDLCNGASATQNFSITAPRDTTTFVPLAIDLGSASVPSLDHAVVPLNLVTPVTPAQYMNPATFDVLYDTACLAFEYLTFPQGSIWTGVNFAPATIPGGVRITTSNKAVVDGNGLLCNLVFKTTEQYDSTTCPVEIVNWQFNAGCYSASVDPGTVTILPVERLNLILSGGRIICDGDSVTLSLPGTFDSYLWSPHGQTTPTIAARTSADYSCMAVSGNDTVYTDTVKVRVIGGPQRPVLHGDTIVCANSPVSYGPYGWTLDDEMIFSWRVEGGDIIEQEANSATVMWGDGPDGKVVFMYGNGTCTDSLILDIEILWASKLEITNLTPLEVCEGDTVELQAELTLSRRYLWSNGDTLRTIRVTEAGEYKVLGFFTNGCRTWSDPVTVVVHPLPPQPVITQSGNELTCSIEADSYTWFKDGNVLPGETGRSLIITEDGQYQVVIANEFGCENASAVMAFTGIGDYAPGLAKDFGVSPNPSNGAFRVSLEFERPTAFSLRLVNTVGTEVYSETVQQPTVSYLKNLHLGGTPPGMYFLILGSGDAYDFRKVIIQSR